MLSTLSSDKDVLSTVSEVKQSIIMLIVYGGCLVVMSLRVVEGVQGVIKYQGTTHGIRDDNSRECMHGYIDLVCYTVTYGCAMLPTNFLDLHSRKWPLCASLHDSIPSVDSYVCSCNVQARITGQPNNNTL